MRLPPAPARRPPRMAAFLPLILLASAATASPQSPAAADTTAQSRPTLDVVLFGAGYERASDDGPAAGVHRYTWGFEMCVGVAEHLGVGLLFTDTAQRFDAPDIPWPGLGAADDRMNANTTGADASAVASWRTGPFEPFLRAGAGFHRTTLTVSGQVLGLPQQAEEVSWGLGLHAGAGIILRLGSWRIHGEARWRSLSGDLPRLGGGDVDLGGRYLVVGVGRRLAFS